MTLVIAGIDPSLTGTGVALIENDGESVTTVASKGKTSDSIRLREARLQSLKFRVLDLVSRVDRVAIETPAHNQTSGHHHDRSGLWWLIVSLLYSSGIHVHEVSTTQVKKYATGRGNASKMEVMAAAIKRYPQFDIANDNEADAVVLAAFLARALGQPIEGDMPKANLAALDKFEVQL